MKAQEKIQAVIESLNERIGKLQDSIQTATNQLNMYTEVLNWVKEEADSDSVYVSGPMKQKQKSGTSLTWNQIMDYSRKGLEELVEEEELDIIYDSYSLNNNGVNYLREDIAIALNITIPGGKTKIRN